MILYSVGEVGSTLEDESSVAPSPATAQNSAFGALLWARPKTVMKEVRSVQALGPAWTLGEKFSPPQYMVTLSATSP